MDIETTLIRSSKDYSDLPTISRHVMQLPIEETSYRVQQINSDTNINSLQNQHQHSIINSNYRSSDTTLSTFSESQEELSSPQNTPNTSLHKHERMSNSNNYVVNPGFKESTLDTTKLHLATGLIPLNQNYLQNGIPMTPNRRPIISPLISPEIRIPKEDDYMVHEEITNNPRSIENIRNIRNIRNQDFFDNEPVINSMKSGFQPSLSEMNTTNECQFKQWYPRVLVIGPGGVKGLKILGFLSPVEDSGLLEYLDTYCGVSVGAVISLLIICGYQIREIVGEAVKLDIFNEIGALNFKSIMENKGFISNEPVRKLLTQLVINKFGNVPSLYGLYMRTGKAFIAVTLNATDETCVMLNPFSNPDISCVDATMFSMNIPFVFYQLVYRGKTYVDGALANPYPVDYFDDGKTNILGIYMKTIHSKNTTPVTTHLPGTIVQKVEDSSSTIPIGAYSLKIIHSLMDHRRNQIIQQSSDKCKHVCLETKTTDTIGYTVTTDDKALMLVEGFNEGKSFLDQLQSGTYSGPTIPQVQKYKYPTYYMSLQPDSPLDYIGGESTESTKLSESHDENIEILSSMSS